MLCPRCFNNINDVLIQRGSKVIKSAIKRRAEAYLLENGHSSFRGWLIAMKDARARAKITKAVIQMGQMIWVIINQQLAAMACRRAESMTAGVRYSLHCRRRSAGHCVGGNKFDQRSQVAPAKRYLADNKARQPKRVKNNVERSK